MKNKKILILGSSGFLGRNLFEKLCLQNEIVQFDINPPKIFYKNSKFVQGSILDKSLLSKAIKGVDIVYHFAAMTDIDIVNNNPAMAIEINIAGTTNVLEACVNEKVDRLIFSSSIYVYSRFGGIYKATKQACELLIEDYYKMYGLNFSILQIGSVYGCGVKKTNLISRLILEAITTEKMCHYGSGKEMRQHIHIKDVVSCSIKIINKIYKNKKIILLGVENISINNLMDKIILLLDKKIIKDYKIDDYKMHYNLTPFDSKPDNAIHFNTKSFTSLDEGLLKTIAKVKKELLYQ